jgi:hypothetical protein
MSESATLEQTQTTTNEPTPQTVDELLKLNPEATNAASVDSSDRVALENVANIAAGDAAALQSELRDAINNGANLGDIDDEGVQAQISQSNNLANSASAAMAKPASSSVKGLRRRSKVQGLTDDANNQISELQEQENFSKFAMAQQNSDLSSEAAEMLQNNQQSMVNNLSNTAILQRASDVVQQQASANLDDPMIGTILMQTAINSLPYDQQKTLYDMTGFAPDSINQKISRFSEEGLINSDSLNHALKNVNDPSVTNDLTDKEIVAIYMVASLYNAGLNQIESYMQHELKEMQQVPPLTKIEPALGVEMKGQLAEAPEIELLSKPQ